MGSNCLRADAAVFLEKMPNAQEVNGRFMKAAGKGEGMHGSWPMLCE